jgi:hypothetical protein
MSVISLAESGLATLCVGSRDGVPFMSLQLYGFAEARLDIDIGLIIIYLPFSWPEIVMVFYSYVA